MLLELCKMERNMKRCAKQTIGRVNSAARYGFRRNVEAVRKLGYAKARERFGRERSEYFQAAYDILWSREFSNVEEGAGSWASCRCAEEVGDLVGVTALVVGHTTHPRITRYCPDSTKSKVPVYVVDTHRLDCSLGCDFEMGGDSFVFEETNLPQSLRVDSYVEVDLRSSSSAQVPGRFFNRFSACSRGGDCAPDFDEPIASF